ncbi:Putative intermembrane space protein MIX23 [Septoria linicola]|uniref:Intermembrane space protein MIX23 n=1 Tax=Septoria linicola TaxID=215465 RepID=A0A9Q9AGG6_9PEZI|nr:putative intermembrane space protein MIX23 [Septoria linicola]USW47139.1 Putative intermembrane space protein MIX23 [Septoria linicola]
MSYHTTQSKLTPQFCFNQTALRDFLRVSRSSVDDTILQNLNALATPAVKPFDPASTTERQSRPVGRRALDPTACQTFKDKVLFPSWQSRADVLNFCASVATSPDPEDPDHVLRETQDAQARERIIDERLDPYSARYFPQDTRTESLAGLVRNERMVENIVRARTWALVGERCENDTTDAEKALNQWRSRRNSTRGR